MDKKKIIIIVASFLIVGIVIFLLLGFLRGPRPPMNDGAPQSQQPSPRSQNQ